MSKVKGSFSISEMANKLGVAPSTLRYYDIEGLLPFLERSKCGTHAFNDADNEFMKNCECLKASRLQIKDIRDFIYLVLRGDEAIADRLQLFEKYLAVIEQQTIELQEPYDTLNFNVSMTKQQNN